MNRQSIQAEIKLIISAFFSKHQLQSTNDLEKHLHAAVDWILHAQQVNGDGGIAASYKMILGKWTLSYPETTGYTIPTLLAYAKQYERPEIVSAVLRMAEYELSVQLPEGGFPRVQNKPGDKTWPVAFDTGQVLFGLFASHNVTSDSRYLESSHRAGDWLVAQQTPEGYWLDYHKQGSLQAIDARVAWPLLILFDQTGDIRFKEAAQKQLEWVLKQQLANGCFNHCSFSPNEPPITHTIAYTIEGLLESGIILGEDRYISAAKAAADTLLNLVNQSGFLAGAFDHDWNPTVSWCCLTGSAQMARIWLRLGEITSIPAYHKTAEQVIRFVAATQRLDGMPNGIYGGIAGSWPIYGDYMRLKYPNWAANFFVDAILRLQS